MAEQDRETVAADAEDSGHCRENAPLRRSAICTSTESPPASPRLAWIDLKRSISSIAKARIEEAVAERCKRLHQGGAVPKPGQRIAQRVIGDGGFGFLAGGDVGDQSKTAVRGAARPHHRRAQFEPGIAAVLAAHAEFDAEGETVASRDSPSAPGRRPRGPRRGRARSRRHASCVRRLRSARSWPRLRATGECRFGRNPDRRCPDARRRWPAAPE